LPVAAKNSDRVWKPELPEARKRRTDAGAFFAPAIRCYGGRAGQPQGWPGSSDTGFPPLYVRHLADWTWQRGGSFDCYEELTMKHRNLRSTPAADAAASSPLPDTVMLRTCDDLTTIRIQRSAGKALFLTVATADVRLTLTIEIDYAAAFELARALRLQAEALTAEEAARVLAEGGGV
jgi:hypothetical protein